jgi:hypothetical protein
LEHDGFWGVPLLGARHILYKLSRSRGGRIGIARGAILLSERLSWSDKLSLKMHECTGINLNLINWKIGKLERCRPSL